MAKTFYITTPIYYPSGKLHIGSAYTTCLCDTLKRYKDLQGYDTRFLTGMDEHGLKIAEAAKKNHKAPQEHVDHIAEMTKELWRLLAIKNDDFIRTTEKRHESVVQDIFQDLLDSGDIYLGKYSGNYCVECEAYFTPTQLKESELCPDCGRPTSIVKEETYFFRLSKYQDRLLKYIEEHPDFIFPETRKNEVVQFIKSGLNDLSVSRTSFDWGVKVKSDPRHVIYVWIDALSNYISALGYRSKDESLYQKYWIAGDEIIHVIGKDILRFHAVYWPCILMAIGEPINFRLFVHGWYLMKDGKISKSKGNVIYPEQLVENYGLDAFRYYIVKDLPYGNDGLFTPEDYVTRINTELANDYGNLVSRVITMVNKYFSGFVSHRSHTNEIAVFERDLEGTIEDVVNKYQDAMDEFRVSQALFEVSRLISRTNKLIDETLPWDLAKSKANSEVLQSVLYHLLEAIRIATILYQPVLIETPAKVFAMLEVDSHAQSLASAVFGFKSDYQVAPTPIHVFPRLDYEKEVAKIRQMMGNHECKPMDLDKPVKPAISVDVFNQIEIKVGIVKEASFHKNAKKLVILKIDTGDKIRQVVSGIADYYKPQALIGMRLLVITNLEPIKLRGELSEGMILCGESESGDLSVIEASGSLGPGDEIR
ncbi:MAG: methionine--tRNA ligase [Candidatus Izemoplasmatales bacterium]|jgi:methionyl-tRNA synthetase